jgi:hypothetical protein
MLQFSNNVELIVTLCPIEDDKYVPNVVFPFLAPLSFEQYSQCDAEVPGGKR